MVYIVSISPLIYYGIYRIYAALDVLVKDIPGRKRTLLPVDLTVHLFSTDYNYDNDKAFSNQFLKGEAAREYLENSFWRQSIFCMHV